jgi:hypothetical protein
MPEPATHAWGHCMAVLRAPKPAEQAAAAALRRGGRSLSSVLAHARSAALTSDGLVPVVDVEEAFDPDLDVVGLAGLLAGTRPADERAVIDLDARLDRGQLARALGLPAAQAAARVAEVAARWDGTLDPALLAWLGPGDCQELAATLGWTWDEPEDAPPSASPGEPAPHNLAELVALADAVAAHSCDKCSDRRRAMVSVRALQAQVVVPPMPPSVRAAATTGRLGLPGPLPPPIDATFPPRRRRVGLAAFVVVLAAGLAVGALVLRHDNDAAPNPLTALPKSGNALAFTSTVITPDGAATLRNTSSHPLTWQVTPSVAWVRVSPTSGRLEPGNTVILDVVSLSSAPPGASRASISVAGSDGSTAAADVTNGEVQPIDLAATVDGCTVRAQVVDTVDPVVALHYRVAASDEASPMTGGPGSYTATLPPGGVTWWVTATDSSGGSARTSETLTTCPG